MDIGCGRGIVGALIRIYRDPERIVGVDAFEPYISFCRRTGQYSHLLNLDVRTASLPFNKDEFDLATALEVIEHAPVVHLGVELVGVGDEYLPRLPRWVRKPRGKLRTDPISSGMPTAMNFMMVIRSRSSKP